TAQNKNVAEGVGFEPTIRLRVCRFSRPVYSTTLAPLLRPVSKQGDSRQIPGKGITNAAPWGKMLPASPAFQSMALRRRLGTALACEAGVLTIVFKFLHYAGHLVGWKQHRPGNCARCNILRGKHFDLTGKLQRVVERLADRDLAVIGEEARIV